MNARTLLRLNRELVKRFCDLASNSLDENLRVAAARDGFLDVWSRKTVDVFMVVVNSAELTCLCRLLESDRRPDASSLSFRLLSALHAMHGSELDVLAKRHGGNGSRFVYQMRMAAEVEFTLERAQLSRLYDIAMMLADDACQASVMPGGFLLAWASQTASPPLYERRVTATTSQLEVICRLLEDDGPSEALDAFRVMLDEARRAENPLFVDCLRPAPIRAEELRTGSAG